MRLGLVSQSGMVPIISIMLLLDAHVHKPLGASLSRETRDRLAGNTKREKTQKTNRSRKEEKNRNEKNPPDASHLESRSIASRPHCPFGSMTRLAGRVCRRITNLSIAVWLSQCLPVAADAAGTRRPSVEVLIVSNRTHERDSHRHPRERRARDLIVGDIFERRA